MYPLIERQIVMTMLFNGSPSPEAGNVSDRADQSPEPKPRVLALPAHLREIPTCAGIPDLFTTYCLNIGLALLFSGVFAALLYWPFGDRSFFQGGLIMLILWPLMLWMVAWMIVIFIRGIRRPGVWFQVDPDGFRYGNGISPDPTAPKARCIEWSSVAANPGLDCDVRYNTSSRVSMRPASFTFWQRAQRQSVEKYTLPKSLTSYDAEKDGIRSVRFKNRHALMVAILCGLAHQGVRFDLNTFIAAGVHPETWQKLRQPWRAATVYFSLIVVLGLVAFEIWGRDSLAFPFAVFTVSLAYYCSEGKYDFSPDLRKYPKGPVVFHIDHADEAGAGLASATAGRG